MTTDYWASVPSADEPESTDSTSSRPRRARPRLARRTMFKTMGVLGGALALNVVGALPPARIRSASARVGTEWTHCAGFGGWAGYDNNTKICVGAPYSRSYCGSDGWFRTDGNAYSAYIPIQACGTGSYSKKNAWRWTHSGTPYRCADGYFRVYGSGDTFYICSWSNP
ncbi:hypothetical protein [Nonomuraea basaltis]|uniref:hypothetical protein n=1 Tax=Nonomuraea basaltis TaxID=2495887 RepID=UPI00110C5468|nr:hypothetical protein [Nonomuraea basaltis]TMR93520.1 hypothetical protein EJK15_38925 [Nonomuraea basaltis]